jgi:hypothetical protein
MGPRRIVLETVEYFTHFTVSPTMRDQDATLKNWGMFNKYALSLAERPCPVLGPLEEKTVAT